MQAGLRLAITVAAAALAAGCYQPQLKNFGFQCDSSAPKPCPDGYFCHNGFCDDGSGGVPPGGSGGSDQDMAMSVQDMAQPKQDMAQPPDMVVVSSCAHDECTAGVALSKTCSKCAGQVCATGADPYCCSTKWDSTCVSEVGLYCTTKTCP